MSALKPVNVLGFPAGSAGQAQSVVQNDFFDPGNGFSEPSIDFRAEIACSEPCFDREISEFTSESLHSGPKGHGQRDGERGLVEDETGGGRSGREGADRGGRGSCSDFGSAAEIRQCLGGSTDGSANWRCCDFAASGWDPFRVWPSEETCGTFSGNGVAGNLAL